MAALFVAKGGVYDGRPDVDAWDEACDARAYAGPHAVVAHPPCARWCRLAGLVEARWGHKRGDDGGCFASALANVRRCGGVLEHPAWSDAWHTFGLPNPRPDGGWSRARRSVSARMQVQARRTGRRRGPSCEQLSATRSAASASPWTWPQTERTRRRTHSTRCPAATDCVTCGSTRLGAIHHTKNKSSGSRVHTGWHAVTVSTAPALCWPRPRLSIGDSLSGSEPRVTCRRTHRLHRFDDGPPREQQQLRERARAGGALLPARSHPRTQRRHGRPHLTVATRRAADGPRGALTQRVVAIATAPTGWSTRG